MGEGRGATGKADKYEAPQGPVEIALARLWAGVLRVPRIGRRDNFFAKGGYSLLAVRLREAMRREGLYADVRAVLSHPTVAELAKVVRTREDDRAVPANGIPEGCSDIRPSMLPLATLTQTEIDLVVSRVPGGAANIQDIYPLGPLQEGILFHHLLTRQGDPYLSSSVLSFATREVLDRYLDGLRWVIARHDILRTGIEWKGLAEPVQVVWRRAPLIVEEVSLEPSCVDAGEHLRERYDFDRYRIDLSIAPLLRVAVAREPGSERWLALQMFHHLLGDNVSAQAMAVEIEAHLAGVEDTLPAPVQFRDFIARARLGVRLEEHLAFFSRLVGDVTECTAPYGLSEIGGGYGQVSEVRSRLDPDLARRLRARARQLGVSAASLFHVAWAQVLARASGRDDVVFGTVLLGRTRHGEGAVQALGLFINTLPVRVVLRGARIAATVARMHELLTQLLHHEHAPLAAVQRCSSIAAPGALFSAVLNYRHSAVVGAAAKRWEGIEFFGKRSRTNYPLVLSVDDDGDDFELIVQMHLSTAVESVCGFVKTALGDLCQRLESDPDAPVRSIAVLSEAERRRILVDWNAARGSSDEGVSVHALFEQQVRVRPDAVALIGERSSLTYSELNARANQLARYLEQLGVGQHERVAICAERSVEMMVAIAAVLKAGAAYVPLDPSYPDERLAYMIEDAAPRVVLVSAALADRVRSLRAPSSPTLVDLEVDAVRWRGEPPGDAKAAAPGGRNLAYVMYTSGSTGRPKGVAVEHEGIVSCLRWTQQTFQLQAGEAVLQKTPFGFDVSVWEILWPLMAGGSVVLARPGGQKEASYLAALVREHRVGVLVFSPATLSAFLECEAAPACHTVKRVMCIGEALPPALASRCAERLPGAALYNLYGPTEATIAVTSWRCSGDDPLDTIPIGSPITNTQLYILDDQLEPAPVLVAGELYIGGVQVARGYLNRPDLTAERFVPDPYATRPGSRMYRTGDLARYRADGAIEFLGRSDQQVKVRGHRIELGEIEAHLEGLHGVVNARVIAREDTPGDQRLVAYFTRAEGVDDRATAPLVLARALSRVLPEYMIPAAYVCLPALPLTVNGKLARDALPEPGRCAYGTDVYEAPVGDVELLLAGLWQELLKIERVGRRDNFFTLGGHSLIAVGLIERMRRVGLHTDVRVVLEAPTLAALAEAVEKIQEIVL